MNRRDIDWLFLLAVLSIAAIGLGALTSAAGVGGRLPFRQAIWLSAGLLGMLLAMAIDYRKLAEFAPVLYALTVVSLLYVLVFGLKINGSRSWVGLGSFNLQPSEFMKIATILLLGSVLSAQREAVARLGVLVQVVAVVSLPLLLVLMQPDMGTGIIFAAILGSVLFSVGLRRRTWAALALAGVLGAIGGWSYVLKDYQKARIRTFLVPETDALAGGYQIIQSRIAIGSGGLYGRGFAAGTQSQLNFIPEKHTDFIFPVVAEEWGFLGVALVIGLYAFVISRGVRIATQSRDALGAYLVLGIMAFLATHVLINLGMVTGLMPTIGIPLPLMSYGGSSIVSTLIGVGIVLNVRMRRSATA